MADLVERNVTFHATELGFYQSLHGMVPSDADTGDVQVPSIPFLEKKHLYKFHARSFISSGRRRSIVSGAIGVA